METLLMLIIKDIALPEIMNYIRKRYAETGELPTDAEMKAKVVSIADKIIAEGNAFLEKNKNAN